MEINTINKLLSFCKTSEIEQIKQNYSFERINNVLNNLYNRYKNNFHVFVKDAFDLDLPPIEIIQNIYKTLSFKENKVIQFKGNTFVISNNYNYYEENKAIDNDHIFIACRGDSYDIISREYRVEIQDKHMFTRFKVHDFPKVILDPGAPYYLNIDTHRVLGCQFNEESSDIRYISNNSNEGICYISYFTTNNFLPQYIKYVSNPYHERHGQVDEICFNTAIISLFQTIEGKFFKINGSVFSEKEFASKYPYYYSFFQ